MKKLVGIAAVFGAFALAYVWWSRSHDAAPASSATSDARASASERGEVPAGRAAPEAAPAASRSASREPSPAGATDQEKSRPTRLRADQAARLRAAILAAIATNRAPPAPSDPMAAPADPNEPAAQAGQPPVPTLDRRYIRAAIDDIQPLIQECFELARQERPELREARAIVHFAIIGDEQLGGVIEESKLDDGSENMTAALSECVRETMYGLKLRAPEGRGRVEVTYPFRLAVSDAKPGAAKATGTTAQGTAAPATSPQPPPSQPAHAQ